MVANGVRDFSAGNRTGNWLAAAERMAVERMEFLYSEAMEAWRASQKTTSMSGRSSCGEPRYLAIAMRINMMSLEMQTRHYAAQQLLKAKLAKLQTQEEPAAKADHPVRDCSPFRGDCQDSGALEAESFDVNNCHEECYDDDQADLRVPLTTQNGSSAPVHHAQPAADDADCLLAGGPQKRELFPRKLNRQERRARQRQLEKLRKARPR